ncbi:MAG: molybdate ABC transporter substrate-binding protein [Nocardioidaceae bacterium]|nr:molybdate ABC transporter substrate-binding protein [Nocardioidaceae bacterium]MCL2612033.1 molybdate ABC transporter substrate-binding protein [Nocardioidaceae bacterium]
MIRKLAVAASATMLAVTLAACGSNGGSGSGKQVFRVLAASSLTDVFAQLEKTFEAQHPGVDVQISYGSSTDLANQASDGAPGDVIATADADSMGLAVKSGAALTGKNEFATNVLVIATKPGNPDHLRSLSDLGGVTWVECDPSAPCGKVSAQLLQAQHVTAKPASLEPDVRSTLSKLTGGDADAALVYASDAKSVGKQVTAVPIPGADKAKADYYVSPLKQTTDMSLANAWVKLVMGAQGQAVFKKAGFGAK